MQETWVGKIPWRRERLLTLVFWPGEFHGLYSPWSCKESDTTQQLSLSSRFSGTKTLFYPFLSLCVCMCVKGCEYVTFRELKLQMTSQRTLRLHSFLFRPRSLDSAFHVKSVWGGEPVNGWGLRLSLLTHEMCNIRETIRCAPQRPHLKVGIVTCPSRMFTESIIHVTPHWKFWLHCKGLSTSLAKAHYLLEILDQHPTRHLF